MTSDEDQPPPRPPRRPLQFSLRAMFGLTAAVSVLFGTLRWLGVPPAASGVILAILIVAALAALGLVLAIANYDGNDEG